MRLVGEQLSPVIGGDYEASALPVGTWEWSIENPGADELTVGLLLSWRNPLGARTGEPPVAGPWAEAVGNDTAAGVRFHDGAVGPAGLRGTFAIAVDGGAGVEVAARSRFDAVGDTELWADFAADGALTNLDDRRPATAGEALGGAVSARVTLAPGESRSIRFAVAWDLPIVEFGGGRQWWKRYTKAWGHAGDGAFELAKHALQNTDAWRAAIEAWQGADPRRPGAAGLVPRGPLQRALFPRRRWHVLGGRRGWQAGSGRGRCRPVRPPRMPRLPVLRHGRRRLLGVRRDPGAVARARAPWHS